MALEHNDIAGRLAGVERIPNAFPGQAASGLESFMDGMARTAENTFSAPARENVASLAVSDVPRMEPG